MLIEPGYRLSIRRQCDLIGLPPSSYYYKPVGESPYNLELMGLMDKRFTDKPFLGVGQMHTWLQRSGHHVNIKRISRLWKLMALRTLSPKPYTSQPNIQHKVYPYLLADLHIDHPGHVWCSDITYIRMHRGFMYLTVVMDWYSRFVLSWELSNSLDDAFCQLALQTALYRYDAPEIFNTDQGAQYTSNDFTGLLTDHGIRISMDGKGRAMDNIMVERLWRTVKYEHVYLHVCEDGRELYAGLKSYFEYYNTDRGHSSLKNQTPFEVYFSRGLALEKPEPKTTLESTLM